MGFNYVVLSLNGESLTREIPIIYPDFISHIDIVRAALAIEGLEGAVPVSAGSLDVATGHCFGKSETLGLVSREDDDRRLINSYPYFHGLY